MKHDYALYKGDRFIDLGTADYLASLLGVKKKTVLFLATPSYQKRNVGHEDKRLIVVKISESDAD